MLTIAVTGGIGSGKSEAARAWAAKGAKLIDADAIARSILEPGEPALEQVRRRWGSAVMKGADLDRQALARIVFGSPEELRALESITHPAITAAVNAQFERFAAPDAIIIYDVPLLLGGPHELACTANVSIAVAPETRIERLIQNRGMDRQAAAKRIESQPSDAQRGEISDVVVNNNSTREEYAAALDELWDNWVLPFARALESGVREPLGAVTGQVSFRDDVNLHTRRLAWHGVAGVEADSGTLEVRGSADDRLLAATGWIPSNDSGASANRVDSWVSANPAVVTKLVRS